MALDSQGVRRRGICQSADAQSAASALRAENLLVVELRKASPLSGGDLASLRTRARAGLVEAVGLCRRVTRRDVIQFFRQLGLMIRSGLTVLRSLEVFRDQCPKLRLARAVGRIAERILKGSTLSAAFEAEPIFPPLAVRMIATGEATGELDVILDRISDQMEHEAEVRNSLLTSLMYPALVMLITAGVVTFLVTKVLPKFAQLLAVRNMVLPRSTQFLLDAAAFLNQWGLWILGGIAVALLSVGVACTTRRGRYAVDRTLLAVPVVGRVITLAFVAHFGRTMAVLLKSGLQILDALKLMGDTVGNKAFGAVLGRAEQEVLEGRPMSSGLRGRIVPRLLPEIVGTGEATGALDSVLEEIGTHYEQRLRREIKLLATLFEPAMILIVGGIVGFVYIAFFQALYQVSAGGR